MTQPRLADLPALRATGTPPRVSQGNRRTPPAWGLTAYERHGGAPGLPASLRFILPVPPSANAYWRSVRGRVVLSREARAYKAGLKAALEARGWRFPHRLTGDVALTLTWYRAIRAGDTGNRIKVVEDALQGIAYANDSQVAELHAVRVDGERPPRIEVRVAEVGP